MMLQPKLPTNHEYFLLSNVNYLYSHAHHVLIFAHPIIFIFHHFSTRHEIIKAAPPLMTFPKIHYAVASPSHSKYDPQWIQPMLSHTPNPYLSMSISINPNPSPTNVSYYSTQSIHHAKPLTSNKIQIPISKIATTNLNTTSAYHPISNLYDASPS
jgi:hypothetical protein